MSALESARATAPGAPARAERLVGDGDLRSPPRRRSSAASSAATSTSASTRATGRRRTRPSRRCSRRSSLTAVLAASLVPFRAASRSARRGARGRALALLAARDLHPGRLPRRPDPSLRRRPRAVHARSRAPTRRSTTSCSARRTRTSRSGCCFDLWLLARLATRLTRYRLVALEAVASTGTSSSALTVVVVATELSPRL